MGRARGALGIAAAADRSVRTRTLVAARWASVGVPRYRDGLMSRDRIRGRATIVWPERPDMDAAPVFLLTKAPNGDWIVKPQQDYREMSPASRYRVPADKLKLEPP